MQNLKTQTSTSRSLSVRVADSAELIEQAQRLRYDVFTAEYGATINSSENIDQDRYDPHCKHLIVLDESANRVIATTRILVCESAHELGQYYSESEFDLTNIKALDGRIMEIGRTCVHASFRNGGTLTLLWSGIAQFLLENDYQYLVGCGSVSMSDGGYQAWLITQNLKENYLCEPHQSVTPKRPLPHLAYLSDKECEPSDAALKTAERIKSVSIPPLIKAYMRLGAKVCGDPCWDPEFKCADLFILLDVDNLSPRYKKHFLKTA